MNKILMSILTIAMVTVVTVGATGAYFSDTETSVGNQLTAGTLDLKVNDADGPAVVHITRSNIVPYPHWSHSYGDQFNLKNAGSIPGQITMTIKNIKNYENGINDPEGEAGDITGGTGIDQGELGGLMFAKWSRNAAPWGGWGSLMDPLNSAEGVVVTGDVLNPGDVSPAYLDLEFDTHAGTVDNTAQSDSVEFDVEFALNQIHP